MALSRRSQRMNSTIWPGFVDAMTGLLLVLMFVLTIFMVIQFVLRETISGQATQLDNLAGQIASLTSALGLEQSRTASLTADLTAANETADAQASRIAALIGERDSAADALVAAQNRITGFEAQVAGLLAQRADLTAQVDGLETRQTELLTEQEQLNLALASARDEVDAQAEAARLAAARREALQALVADLETETGTQAERISDLEATQLADAAAAQALRDRLENADAELTAMTLALEEQRREAEETLTLLAATQSARDELDMNLSAALLAQQQAETDLSAALSQGDDLDERLVAALALQENTAAELDAARAALDLSRTQAEDLTARLAAAAISERQSDAELADARAALDAALAEGEANLDDMQAQLAAAILARQAAETQAENAGERNATLEDRLAEALLARDELSAQVDALRDTTSTVDQQRADINARMVAALAARTDAEEQVDQRTAALAEANRRLSAQEAQTANAQRQTALLNEQVAALRAQVGSLQTLLNVAGQDNQDAEVQIEQLGAQLNTALARVAAEERRRRALEEADRTRLEAEAARLAAEAQNLERFRSDFFGQVRDAVEGLDGVRIDGDRFVFSSEVLFNPGSATLSPQGRDDISNVASLLQQIASEIPDSIDWIIRVDGHTDDIPLSGQGEFADNWELSQARALSVVRYMEDFLDIPPTRLAANGFGEYQPINPADTPAARAQNRRIELKLTER
ncbi:peptidoglycan -binding protein [Loktanella sp. SALINAS62]|uniref:peptidoglycan -binding protein n=1 Tax=Loktanella sp. SALINAS62 TaxID=2706124 RepID=UPI001B8B4240|nr:peptidoglycan -binding protein [Loktanella sp. SALINAS62]MBS1301313.1 peptidoglycan -binding protein [Loktanella sp. SALINAS62]